MIDSALIFQLVTGTSVAFVAIPCMTRSTLNGDVKVRTVLNQMRDRPHLGRNIFARICLNIELNLLAVAPALLAQDSVTVRYRYGLLPMFQDSGSQSDAGLHRRN